MKPNEVEQFFEGLPEADNKVVDIFEEPTAEVTATGPIGEAEPTVRKNREHRRLERKMDEKDEMLKALNERVIELSKPKAPEASTDMPAEWIALYGTTPESQAAWKMQQSLFNNFKESAKQEALQELQSQRDSEKAEQQKFESFIDTELETLEDTFNVDLTSNAPAARKTRREFLEMVEKLSPKDENGDISGYADFESTFEIYKTTREKEKSSDTINRQKELSSRTMTKPSSPSPAPQAPTPGFRGWMKDFGING